MASEIPAIGIDLGTTYSCVSVFQYGKAEILWNDHGNRTTPSYVAFTDIECLIGDAAKNQAAMNPANTVFDAKRLIGRDFDDSCVQSDMKWWPFDVVNEDGKPKIVLEFKGQRKKYSPVEISSMVLTKMKEIAEGYLGATVINAVVTVPAYFNDAQRQATKDAGTMAGLNILRIMNEPSAAAIAYGFDKRQKAERNVLIFDLGGGTFDVSVLSIIDGTFTFKSIGGDTHLGGEDFDNQMVNYFAEEFQRKQHKDLKTNKRAVHRLRTACESAKRTLSASTVATIQIDSFFEGIDFTETVTRAKFEELNSDMFRSIIEILSTALKEANMNKNQINEIVLVGGSTRIPKVQKLLQEFFNGKTLNKSINPDEAVAYGAAIQAAMLSGDQSEAIQDLLLIDVTPLSLSISEYGGLVAHVVKRSTAIPTKQTKLMTTNNNNQTAISFTVFEGERALAKDNHVLGHFRLSGILPAPRGVPEIEVTFSIDSNGILNVAARDQSTGKIMETTINHNRNRLSKEQVERTVSDAEKHRNEDELVRKSKFIASLYEYCSDIKSAIDRSPLKEKISAPDRILALDKCNDAIAWLDANHVATTSDEIERKRYEVAYVLKRIWKRVNK